MSRKPIKRTYTVKEYFCESCSHQFNSTTPGKKKIGNKCGGHLKIIGRNKSTRISRGSPRRGEKWFTRDRFYKNSPP